MVAASRVDIGSVESRSKTRQQQGMTGLTSALLSRPMYAQPYYCRVDVCAAATWQSQCSIKVGTAEEVQHRDGDSRSVAELHTGVSVVWPGQSRCAHMSN